MALDRRAAIAAAVLLAMAATVAAIATDRSVGGSGSR